MAVNISVKQLLKKIAEKTRKHSKGHNYNTSNWLTVEHGKAR